jgi:LL-diaminopimelate aminotransferase
MICYNAPSITKGFSMDIEMSDRLQQLPPYLFADLRRKMREAKSRGKEVIRIDIGDPDTPTPDPVVQELIARVNDPDDPVRHRYGCDVPAENFPQAVRDFYQQRWGITLGEDQVVTTMGSKDAIAKFALGVMNPGDIGIAPQPGYPTYNIGHVFAGGSTHYALLHKENDYLVDFSAIPDDVIAKAKILWLNYPNNPTTAIAPMSFFEQAVAFGREHNILIAHDAAYSENTYDGYDAPSILQVDGADEVAVEFFSLSKAFSMTGWRAGAVVGNASAVAALNTVKENVDNGVLRAIQFAAATALSIRDELVPPLNDIYRRRRDLVVDALNQAGWSLDKPQATIYIWAPVPEKYNQADSPSGQFVADLLEQTGVMVTPGRGYGPTGEGFFRISLTYPDNVLAEAVKRIVSMK